MTRTPAREPVLRAGQFGGLAIPDARESRIWVDERGAVMMRRPGTDPLEVAAPGEVTKVAVVGATQIREQRFRPHARRGLLLLLSGDRLVGAVNLRDLGADTLLRGGPDDASFRALSGMNAVAQALGLFVEPADAGQLRIARRLRQGDLLPLRDPRHVRWWASWWGLVACFACFLLLPAAAESSSLRWLAAAVAFSLVTPLVWRFHARRRHWHHLVNTPPPAEGRQVVRPQPPPEFATAFMAQTEVQVGPRDIVVRAAHREWWLPGPAVGGVTAAVVGPDHLVLEDSRGRPFVGLQPSVWGSHLELLLRALRNVGIEVRESPLIDTRMMEYVATEADAREGWVQTNDYENASDDSHVAPSLPHVAVFTLGIGCVALAGVDFPLGLLVLAPWLVLEVMAVRATWTLHHWVHSRGRPVEPSGARSTGGER